MLRPLGLALFLAALFAAAARANHEPVPPGAAAAGFADAIRALADERGGRPLWLDGGRPNARARAVIAVLRGADAEGLDPAAYALPDGLAPAAFEAALSQRLLRYVSDLETGRPAPHGADPDLFVPRRSLDPLETLRAAAAAPDIAAWLAARAPPGAAYRRLRAALARYRAIAGEGGWAPLPDGPALKPGMTDPRVGALRARLAATGDLAPGSISGKAIDSAVEAAVRAFQGRHGLEADGVVGRRTRAELNVPVEERIRRIVLNMERWRWMPRDLGRDYLFVNIAGFDLEAVSDGETALRMRVIIGRPYRQTPVFSRRMEYLEFNPYWTVPARIAVLDLVPKLRNDPGYFAEQGIRVFDGWEAGARELDPAAVPWERYSRRTLPVRLRQDPGPKNALGTVKFMFPNRFNVYLHDTPAKELFAKDVRAFSSGCIRVEKPHALALWALADQPGWDEARIERTVASGQTTVVRVTRPISVHIGYQTVWVETDGTVHFRHDLYGRDQRLELALFPPDEARPGAKRPWADR